MDVALIQWPSDEALRSELAERSHPRLLLVEPDIAPPICHDPLEDWVRLPVSRADRNARVSALEARFSKVTEALPRVDPQGTLEYLGQRTQLSETQARLIEPMIARFGAVVGRESLTSATWPGSETAPNSLDVAVARLRRRIGLVGLKITTVRSRGYMLGDSSSR